MCNPNIWSFVRLSRLGVTQYCNPLTPFFLQSDRGETPMQHDLLEHAKGNSLAESVRSIAIPAMLS